MAVKLEKCFFDWLGGKTVASLGKNLVYGRVVCKAAMMGNKRVECWAALMELLLVCL